MGLTFRLTRTGKRRGSDAAASGAAGRYPACQRFYHPSLLTRTDGL
jgi:hypothetical protein